MSHAEQRAYTERIAERFPAHFRNKRVLDIGSLSVNGDNTYLCSQCAYTGIDVVPGRNVNIVDPEGMAHYFSLFPPSQLYDTIISTECLEHDLHRKDTLQMACRILRPGGLMVLTAATTGRGEHGTNRSKPWDAPGLPWGDYYENVTEEMVREAIDCEAVFSLYEFSIGTETCDLYFFGLKRDAV